MESKGRPTHSSRPREQWSLPVTRRLQRLRPLTVTLPPLAGCSRGHLWGPFPFRAAKKSLLLLFPLVEEFTSSPCLAAVNLAFQRRGEASAFGCGCSRLRSSRGLTPTYGCCFLIGKVAGPWKWNMPHISVLTLEPSNRSDDSNGRQHLHSASSTVTSPSHTFPGLWRPRQRVQFHLIMLVLIMDQYMGCQKS